MLIKENIRRVITMMKLKQHIDILDFLKAVQACQGEIFLKTEEGDVLNLSSMLSQYIFISNVRNENLMLTGVIESSCKEDYDRLSEFLCQTYDS